MKSWYDIYKERMNTSYLEHVANKYAPFIKELYEVGGRHAFEIGCGAGNVTRILRDMQQQRYGYSRHHTLVDMCPKMLSLAIENNPHPNCAFVCADVYSAKFTQSDLIHSHGLLEHFDDRSIQHMVEKNLYVTPVQIHYVPGAKYEVPSRGDERLLEPEHWEQILRPVGRVTVSTFNDEHDIILKITAR